MSVYRGRPSISLTGTAVAGPFIARRPGVKPRHALVAVAVAIALACLALGIALRGNPGSAAHPAAARALARSYRQEGMLSLPAAAQAPVSAALGHDSPAYRVTPAASGYRAHSPAQRLALRFTRSGVSVRSHHGALGLALRDIGHGTRLRPVGASDPTAAANRVSYGLGGGVREWYANGPLGLEQGFDLKRAPAGRGGPLTLSLAVSGNLRARLANGGLSLTGHGAKLRYAGLVVRDARGRKLRAWLELRQQDVLIRIADRGARYPLRIDPWVQSAELTPGDASSGAEFGYSVAVSGNTVVVGAIHANDGAGAVYVFTRRANGWANATQTAELTPSDPQLNKAFGPQSVGFSVAIDGSTIVAGAPYWSDYSGNQIVEYQGAVYVWTLPKSGVWTNATQTAILSANNLTDNDYLGASVAVQGSTIVVGAPNHIYETPIGGPGSVYVYTMPASGGWVNANQTAQLSGYDDEAGDALGASVAISGSTIVAGAPIEEYSGTGNYAARGGVYVWTEPPSGVWVNASAVTELIPADVHAGDELGTSVAISGSTIVAGAPFHSISNRAGGTAYVWTLPPIGGWGNATQPAELTSTDLSGGLVGEGVAVSGSTIFSGGGYSITTDRGAVYEWTRPASGFWADETQAATLTPGDSAGADLFGDRMAMSNSTLVVGAWAANDGAGRAYVFGGGYTVSGKVLGTQCSDTACTVPAGIPGFTVLVKGTASDGTPVSVTGVSGADGSWSADVPAGAYTAGLSADGVSFASKAMEQPVNVTSADVGNVNFTACDDTTSGTARDLAARDPVAGAAEASFAPSYCESEYTLTLTAKIPQAIVVDASKNSHYNTTTNNGSSGYNHSPSFINAIRSFFRSKADFNEEFPDCMAPGKVALYTREKAKAEWYSYIQAGKIIGTATVQLIWNQNTHKVELAGLPTQSTATLTRIFVYRVTLPDGRTRSGQCPDKAKVPMLLAVQPSGNNNEGAEAVRGHEEEEGNPDSAPFAIEAGMWFPFDSYGATIDPDTSYGERLIDAGASLAKYLFKGAAALTEAYERLPAYGKFLIETGANLLIGIAEEKVLIGALGKAAEFYEQYSTGTRLTAEELEKLELIGTVKGWSELLVKLPLEAYNIYAGYFGYPIMSTVIRGRFTTAKYLPSAQVSPPRYMPYETTLGVTVSTTKFPTWSLEISRDALNTCLSGCKVWEGPLPWYSTVTGEPETFNAFSATNPPYVVQDSTKNNHTYKSGYKAVTNVLADTKQNLELAFGIRHKGSITSNFAAAEEAVPAPSCDADTGRSSSPETICWVFSDWRP